MRRVQRAGVQPHAAGARREGLTDSAREKCFAESATNERRGETEVGDLDVAVRMPLELEEAGALAADEAFENANGRAREMRRQLLLGPGAPVGPVPSRADEIVEPPVVVVGDRVAAYDANGRIVEASRP